MSAPVAGAADLVDVSDRSVRDAFRRIALLIDGGEVRRAGPLEMIASGTPLQVFNVTFIDGVVEDPSAALDEIAAFYGSLGVSYRVVMPSRPPCRSCRRRSGEGCGRACSKG